MGRLLKLDIYISTTEYILSFTCQTTIEFNSHADSSRRKFFRIYPYISGNDTICLSRKSVFTQCSSVVYVTRNNMLQLKRNVYVICGESYTKIYSLTELVL